jgi:hypothetical protein
MQLGNATDTSRFINSRPSPSFDLNNFADRKNGILGELRESSINSNKIEYSNIQSRILLIFD